MFKSQAQAVVEAAVIRAKWNADQARQEEAGNRLDLYMDDYETIIRSKMSELFHKTNYDRLYYHVNQSQNILKRVVNEVSMVYKATPTRELSVESDRYGAICTDLDIDTRMKRINRLT